MATSEDKLSGDRTRKRSHSIKYTAKAFLKRHLHASEGDLEEVPDFEGALLHGIDPARSVSSRGSPVRSLEGSPEADGAREKGIRRRHRHSFFVRRPSPSIVYYRSGPCASLNGSTLKPTERNGISFQVLPEYEMKREQVGEILKDSFDPPDGRNRRSSDSKWYRAKENHKAAMQLSQIEREVNEIPSTVTSNARKDAGVDISLPVEDPPEATVAAKPGNSHSHTSADVRVQRGDEAVNGGLFSSFFSAAQNAAHHLISKTGHDSLETHKTDEFEPEFNDARSLELMSSSLGTMEGGSTFLKHLDFVLSGYSGHGTGPDSSIDKDEVENATEDRENSTGNSPSQKSVFDPLTLTSCDKKPDTPDGLVGDKSFPCNDNNQAKLALHKGTSTTSFGDGNLSLDHFNNRSNIEEEFLGQSPNEALTGGQYPISLPSGSHSPDTNINSIPESERRGITSFDVAPQVNSPIRSLSPLRDTIENSAVHENQPGKVEMKGSLDSVITNTNEEHKRSSNSEMRSSDISIASSHAKPIQKITVNTSGNMGVRANRASSLSVTTKSGQLLDAQNLKHLGFRTPTVSSFDQTKHNPSLSFTQEFQELNYAPDKRNTDFHSLFKDTEISPDERLLTDYSCAWSKDILLQGRLYVAMEHICFYSNILGYVSVVVIPIKDIVQIEKKNTAGIFPNAIAIHTLQKKYVFASFISRDTTFDLITNVWNQLILEGDSVTPFAKQHVVSNNVNLRADGELEYQLGDAEDGENSSSSETDHEENSDGYRSDSDEYSGITSNSEDISQQFSKPSSQTSVPTLGPLEHEATFASYTPGQNEKKVVDAIFDAPLGKVVSILFGENPDHLKSILELQQNHSVSELVPLIQRKERSYSYTRPLTGPIGPAKTTCYITETLEDYDLTQFVKVVQISKTPEVPSGNSFYLKSTYLLSWAENNSTRMTLYAVVEWTAKCWIKSAIEKGAFEGVANAAKVTVDQIHNILKHATKSSTRVAAKKSSPPLTAGEGCNTSSLLPTAGPKEHPPTKHNYVMQSGDSVVEDHISIPAPLGTVFNILFGEDSSYMRRIIEKQKNFGISDIPEFSNGVRSYSYVKPLNNAIGVKQTKCIVEEKILHGDYDTYLCVEQVARTPDVPSGNSFRVHTKFFFTWGSSNSTDILVVGNVHWLSRSWIKGPVEKGSIEGQKVAIKVLAEELRLIISSAQSSTNKRRNTNKSRKKSSFSKSKIKNFNGLAVQVDNSSIVSVGGIAKARESLIVLLKQFTNLFFPFELSGGSLLALFILFTTITTIFLTSKYHSYRRTNLTCGHHQGNVAITGTGKITIDGLEYIYTPSLDTLLGLKGPHSLPEARDKNRRHINPRVSAENSIWEWLELRSQQSSDTESSGDLKLKKPHIPNSHFFDGSSLLSTIERIEGFKRGDYIEAIQKSISATELQLKELKDKINAIYQE